MEEINYSENGGWMRYVMLSPLQRQSVTIIWKEDEVSNTLIQRCGVDERLSVLMFVIQLIGLDMKSMWIRMLRFGFGFIYDSKKKCFRQNGYSYRRVLPTKINNFLINLLPTARPDLVEKAK